MTAPQLIKKLRRLWDAYKKNDTQDNLLKVKDQIDVMAASKAKTVKAELTKIRRVFNAEMKVQKIFMAKKFPAAQRNKLRLGWGEVQPGFWVSQIINEAPVYALGVYRAGKKWGSAVVGKDLKPVNDVELPKYASAYTAAKAAEKIVLVKENPYVKKNPSFSKEDLPTERGLDKLAKRRSNPPLEDRLLSHPDIRSAVGRGDFYTSTSYGFDDNSFSDLPVEYIEAVRGKIPGWKGSWEYRKPTILEDVFQSKHVAVVFHISKDDTWKNHLAKVIPHVSADHGWRKPHYGDRSVRTLESLFGGGLASKPTRNSGSTGRSRAAASKSGERSFGDHVIVHYWINQSVVSRKVVRRTTTREAIKEFDRIVAKGGPETRFVRLWDKGTLKSWGNPSLRDRWFFEQEVKQPLGARSQLANPPAEKKAKESPTRNSGAPLRFKRLGPGLYQAFSTAEMERDGVVERHKVTLTIDHDSMRSPGTRWGIEITLTDTAASVLDPSDTYSETLKHAKVAAASLIKGGFIYDPRWGWAARRSRNPRKKKAKKKASSSKWKEVNFRPKPKAGALSYYTWSPQRGMTYKVLEGYEDGHWNVEMKVTGGAYYRTVSDESASPAVTSPAKAKRIAEAHAKKYKAFLTAMAKSPAPWKFDMSDRIMAKKGKKWVILKQWNSDDGWDKGWFLSATSDEGNDVDGGGETTILTALKRGEKAWKALAKTSKNPTRNARKKGVKHLSRAMRSALLNGRGHWRSKGSTVVALGKHGLLDGNGNPTELGLRAIDGIRAEIADAKKQGWEPRYEGDVPSATIPFDEASQNPTRNARKKAAYSPDDEFVEMVADGFVYARGYVEDRNATVKYALRIYAGGVLGVHEDPRGDYRFNDPLDAHKILAAVRKRLASQGISARSKVSKYWP